MTTKRIGFIDEFLDNWHANNYPRLFREHPLGSQYEVALAWEMRPAESGLDIDQWCGQQQVARAASIEQVVAECDAIVVLAPRNADVHERPADVPPRAPKPVYIDKPFAPNIAAGRRMFDKAREHGTPMFSSSALRFGSALNKALSKPLDKAPAGELADKAVRYVATRGGGRFAEYAIHQVEMLVMTLGVGARQVMHVGNDTAKVVLVDYGDGRRGTIALTPGASFGLLAAWGEPGAGGTHAIDVMDDFFPGLIDAMLRFFDSGAAPVPQEQTLEVTAILQAANAGMDRPGRWVDVPR
jgi:hypothetical protein